MESCSFSWLWVRDSINALFKGSAVCSVGPAGPRCGQTESMNHAVAESTTKWCIYYWCAVAPVFISRARARQEISPATKSTQHHKMPIWGIFYSLALWMLQRREEEWECSGIPQNICTDEIYSNTENMLADVICCFRLGWFPLSFDPDSEIILAQFLHAGHEIFTSYQMNNISSITFLLKCCSATLNPSQSIVTTGWEMKRI